MIDSRRVIVIGGGAAGMISAAVAARRGIAVTLIERNRELGRKLCITGKGRCNLTNNCSVDEVLKNTPNGGRFLQSALNAFTPFDTIELFETLGVPLKTERGNRVFPKSDDASDINNALIRFMDENGVIVKHARVLELLVSDGQITGVKTSSGVISCETVIIATGGISYPATGSTGDGYSFAEHLGHSIIPPRASLVPLEADPGICSKMQGLTLKNVKLRIYDNNKKLIFEDFGELLFTHFGISGPLTLSASAHMRDFDTNNYLAVLDMKPALDDKKLDQRILRDFEKYSNKDLSNALGDLLVRLLIPVIIEKSGIAPDTKVHSVTRAERNVLRELIKNFPLSIIGTRPIDEAVITSGGVDLREINPKTMESKIVKGLYFAGEVINADAYTGGFNLQIAWSTGYAAGSYA